MAICKFEADKSSSYWRLHALYPNATTIHQTVFYLQPSKLCALANKVSVIFLKEFYDSSYIIYCFRFHDDLMSMEDTHPGISEYFENGGISIRRTNKGFSRVPIDLTLEQTINRDAVGSSGNKLFYNNTYIKICYYSFIFCLGIISCTDNLGARNRWAKGHQARTSIASYIYDYLKLNRKEDISQEAYPRRMKKDHEQLEALKSMITNNKNPFTECEKELFNISTGKAAPQEVCDFLLHVYETGEKSYNAFVQSVIDDPAAFEKPIKKQRLLNFASMAVKVKKIVNGKATVLQMERNLFSRLLTISLEKKICMDLVLEYPLTPVPLVFGQLDGSMNKTTKSVIYDILDARVKSPAPRVIDALLVDGFFFLHVHGKQLPNTFGKVAKHILKELCRTSAKRIDLVFDQILTPSIKDAERDRRCTTTGRDAAYNISGPNQVCPSNFIGELRNDNFKRAFVKFLVIAMEDDSFAEILGQKSLYITQDSLCYSFIVSDGKVIRRDEPALFSNHEEADTRLFAHISTVIGPATVVIRTSDSDILAIAVGNHWKLPHDIQVFLELGLVSNNTLRYVNVTKMYKKLGDELSKSIPAFHALTGCDFNPAFSRRGKKGPFSVLQKKPEYQRALSTLGSSETISDETFASIEKFTCDIYPKNKSTSINEARRIIFERAYKPTKNKPFGGLKGIDGSNLPPCQSVLLQQIRRANFICFSWNNATDLKPGNCVVDSFLSSKVNSFLFFFSYPFSTLARVESSR